MFANISDYQTDSNVENEGVDLGFGNGRFITIRRAGGSNTTFKTYFASEYGKLGKDVEGKVLDNDEATNVMFDIYAKTIVMDWRGWTDAKGKEIPFSVSNCITLFKEAEEIWLTVYDNAQKLSNFRSLEVQDSGKE